MRKRLKPTDRKASILAAAMRLAEAHGYRSITRCQVADEAGASPALINAYWPTMDHLRICVLRTAVRRRVIPIVAQGLGVRDQIALDAPADLLEAVALWVTGGGSL